MIERFTIKYRPASKNPKIVTNGATKEAYVATDTKILKIILLFSDNLSSAREFDKMKVCVNIGKWKDANFNKFDNWINKSLITAQYQKFFFKKLSSNKLKKVLLMYGK